MMALSDLSLHRAAPRAAVTALLVLILAIGAWLRFPGLDALSLWYDEGWSYYVASLNPAEALQALVQHADPHPPGYYLVLIAWCRLFGVSVVSLRGLSATVSLVSILAMYGLGCEMGSLVHRQSARLVGLLAAALLALSPAEIMYAHEGRMYAQLGLCTILLLALYARLGLRRTAWRRWHWAALVLVEALALYTHFFAVFLIASLALWMLARLLLEARRGDRRPLLQWIVSQLAVAALYVPWLPVTLERAAGHVTGTTYVPPLGQFASQVWSFLLSGQTDLLGPNPVYARWALCALIVTAGVVALGLVRRPTRPAALMLALQCALPFAGVYLLMLARPGFHPRYLLLILYPLLACLALALSAAALSLRGKRAPAGLVLVLVFCGVWLTATGTGYRLAAATAPWRDDARGLVADLAADLPSGSGLIAAYTGWELRPYLQDTTLQASWVSVAHSQEEVEAELSAWLEDKPQVAYVRWGQSDTDHAGVIPYILSSRGRLVAERTYPGYQVAIYALDAVPQELLSAASGVRFGDLELVSHAHAAATPADGALAVGLSWRLQAPMHQSLKYSLTLWDRAGHLLGQVDRPIVDRWGRQVPAWQPETSVTLYATLPLGVGLLPGDYALELAVYGADDLAALEPDGAGQAQPGRRVPLAMVRVLPPREVDPGTAIPALASRLALAPLQPPAPLSAGLALTGLRIERDAVSSGERLGVLAEWERTGPEVSPALLPEWRLVRGDTILVRATPSAEFVAFPPDQWSVGARYVDWLDMVIPADVGDGPATVEVGLPGGQGLSLGQIQISAVPRLMEAPPMRCALSGSQRGPLGGVALLSGYDVTGADVQSSVPPCGALPDASKPWTAGGELTVRLVWRAQQASVVPLVAFVHLVSADGRLIAQHDGPPVSGARPTTGWRAEEYLVDSHTLDWLDASYTGEASLHVGLYDPATGQRQTLPDGADHLVLPITLMIAP